MNDNLKVLLVFIENGGEICVSHQSFAKYNKIGINLVHEIEKIKFSVNDAMDKFTELIYKEFESDEDDK